MYSVSVMLFFIMQIIQKKIEVSNALFDSLSYMNILWCLLLIAALTSLFVTGPNLGPGQSYAAVADGGDHKITKDYKDSIHKDVNAGSDSTNQHLGKDNLCYRDDDCEQANEGGQVEARDNAADGFNDQNKNTQEQQQQQQQPVNLSSPTPTPQTGTVMVTRTSHALTALNVHHRPTLRCVSPEPRATGTQVPPRLPAPGRAPTSRSI